jgi:hypothetical protein
MFDFVAQAFAQPLGAIGVDPASTPTVEITNIVGTLVQAVGVMLLTAVAAWTRSHLNDAAAQKTVLTAAENAVAYAENRLGVKGDQPYTVPVASAVGRMAIAYMNAHVADAVKYMGLDDASLSRIIISKMPDVKDGGIDEGTFNGIVSSASGKPSAPADYGQLLSVFGPMIQQQVETALAAHYGAKPTTAAPVVKATPAPETTGATAHPEVG